MSLHAHVSDRGNCPRELAGNEFCTGIILRLSASKFIASLSLVKNSEDKEKINYAVAHPEEVKKLQKTKRIEGRAAATE